MVPRSRMMWTSPFSMVQRGQIVVPQRDRVYRAAVCDFWHETRMVVL